MIHVKFQDVDKVDVIQPSAGITFTRELETLPTINSDISYGDSIYRVVNITYVYETDEKRDHVLVFIKKHSTYMDHLTSFKSKGKRIRLLNLW